MTQPLWTVEQAAERLHTTARTVRKYLREGRLRGVKINRRDWRISPAEVEAFIERNTRPE